MSKAPPGIEDEQLTVVARCVLLDGLTALECHLDAVTVVGAQAVYLRSTGASVSAAAYTSDGDLSIDPELLGDEPLLEEALLLAGFEPMKPSQPGLWCKTQRVGDAEYPIELDLLVGSTLAAGGRGARLPPHAKNAARKVPGLEACVVDRAPMLVTALEPQDQREITVNVAGPAALMVAKGYKIADRLSGKSERLQDKDAGDVLRLMMTSNASEVAATFDTLVADERVGDVASQGLIHIRDLFGGARTSGVDMAVRALAGSVPEQRVRALAPAFVRRLPGSP